VCGGGGGGQSPRMRSTPPNDEVEMVPLGRLDWLDTSLRVRQFRLSLPSGHAAHVDHTNTYSHLVNSSTKTGLPRPVSSVPTIRCDSYVRFNESAWKYQSRESTHTKCIFRFWLLLVLKQSTGSSSSDKWREPGMYVGTLANKLRATSKRSDNIASLAAVRMRTA
jgi:hypothetical protein